MSVAEPISTRIVGNYALRSSIGRGGTSEVFAAEHRFLGDPVAVKLLRSHLSDDPAATESFLTEAARTRSIDHPHVVRVLDFGHDATSGCCYLVMERIEGGSLAAHLRRTGPLAEADARALLAAIADGMHAAHTAGIVHRDLKPANIMLGATGPKIVDFGIAKFLGGAAAATTTRRVGTPAYMAPEQITGGLIAPCTDVWAFGVMLFEAVTGRLPFEDVTDGRCPQLFELAPRAAAHATISPALDRLIARCLEREPGKRPATMAELALALRDDAVSADRITQDVGVGLEPVRSIHPHAEAPPRRHLRWAIAGGAAVAIGIAIAMLVPLAASESPEAMAATASPSLAPTEAPPKPEPEPESIEAPPVAEPAVARPIEAPPQPPVAFANAAFEVEIRSMPAGAAIVVDGKPRGVTPSVVAVVGPASIVVKHRGYLPSRVVARRAGPIDVRLVPVRRAARPRTSPTRETLD